MDVHRALLLSLPLLLVVSGFELAHRGVPSDASPTINEAKATMPASQVGRRLASTKSAKRRPMAPTAPTHAVNTRALNAVAVLGLGITSLSVPVR